MNYRHMAFSCESGHTPARILEVGLTAAHELVVHFWCSECSRVTHVTKRLSDCWRECPEAEVEDDATFLQSIGVRFLEDLPT